MEKTAAQQYQRAATVAKYVELMDIRLVAVEATTHGSSSECLEAMPWKIEPSRTASFELRDTSLLVRAEFGLLFRSAAASDGPALVAVRCAFELAYKFEAVGAPTGAELETYLEPFARLNAVYNAWPYYRELVQSTISRMGLPPIVIPVFRVNDELEAASEKALR